MRRSNSTLHHFVTLLTGTGLATTARLLGRIGRPRQAHLDRHDSEHRALATVSIVEDPDGSMRLIGVTGIAEPVTIDRIAEAIFDDPITDVHLDLGGTVAWMPGALGQLEQVLDEAELLSFRLRVIGLDPHVLTLPDQLWA